MSKRKRQIYPIAIIILGLILVFSAVGISSLNIQKNLELEMQNTLGDVASQNVLAVYNEVEMQYRFLKGYAEKLQNNPGQETEFLKDMQTFVNTYEFKRMGYINPDGTAYTTDGHTLDLGDRNFFLKSMEGKPWISETLEDRVTGERGAINVFSVPVYEESGDAVKGVLFATYRNEIFRDMMDVEFFGGQGFSCIIRTDGAVIAHSQNSVIEETENFLEHICHENNENCDTVERMKATMEAGGSGYGECEHSGGEGMLFYYRPVNENIYGSQWYMVAIAPRSIMDARMAPVLANVQMLAFALVVIAVLGVAAYIFLQRKRKKELESLAYEDSLTGGYNFVKFREMAGMRSGLSGYVIAMDLAGFKLINSGFGVKKGDETLLALWKLLRENVTENEMVARVNADRFVLFLQEQDKASLENRLQKLIEAIGKIPEQLNIPSLFPVFGIYYANTLDEADKYYGFALQAKHLVKGRRDRYYAFYDEIDSQKIIENRELEDSFKEALEKEEFEVWYQPKYSAQEGKIIGAEALVRWRRADGKMLSPGVFIPLFEQNGNIAVLDEYVFRKVCKRQKERLDAGKKMVPISVNISRVSLYFDRIVERYESILKEIGLDVKYIQLEITESATVENVDIGDLVKRFHQVGFEMQLDDFGSGYSALASLNTIPFDTVKLDKSLIDYIGDTRGEKLLTHVTMLGQSLGLHITAEGVETHEQVAFLKNLKCDDIQGYVYSRPLPINEYEALVEE